MSRSNPTTLTVRICVSSPLCNFSFLNFLFHQVGEQILEVNGISFMNISHADAAHIIRTSKMMTIILKDVAKVPLARIIYDGTEWLSLFQLFLHFVIDKKNPTG